MGFSRQEYWSGLSLSPPGDLPHPGSNPVSYGSCIAGRFFTAEPPGKPLFSYTFAFPQFVAPKDSVIFLCLVIALKMYCSFAKMLSKPKF